MCLRPFYTPLFYWVLGGGTVLGESGRDLFFPWFESQGWETFSPLSVQIQARGRLRAPGRAASRLGGGQVGPPLPLCHIPGQSVCLDIYSCQVCHSPAGQLQFQSAMLRTALWNASQSAGDIAAHLTIQHTDPPFNNLKPGFLSHMDNTDVLPVWFPRKSPQVLTTTDFRSINCVDLQSLALTGPLPLDGISNHPAHYTDPSTGEESLVNWLGKETAQGAEIRMYKMDASLRRSFLQQVAKVDYLPFSIHAVASVGNYAVI
eukprot:g50403.t1